MPGRFNLRRGAPVVDDGLEAAGNGARAGHDDGWQSLQAPFQGVLIFQFSHEAHRWLWRQTVVLAAERGTWESQALIQSSLRLLVVVRLGSNLVPNAIEHVRTDDAVPVRTTVATCERDERGRPHAPREHSHVDTTQHGAEPFLALGSAGILWRVTSFSARYV